MSNKNSYSDTEIKKILRDHSSPKRFLKYFILLSLSSFLLISSVGIYWLYEEGVFSYTETDLKPITDYQAQDNSLVFDKDNQKIGELFSRYYVYTPLEEIPTPMVQAVLAIEDRNFKNHRGIDPKAILRAAINVAKTKSLSQGASTITQQLVRNLILSREKTIIRKIKEISLSLLLESHFNKDKILEIYLNALFLGNGSYGVAAASLRYFGKPLNQLELHEHALIAGLFQSPSAYNPHRFPRKARARQKKVLVAMARAGYLTVSEAKLHLKKKLSYTSYSSLNSKVSPYFIDYVREQTEKILGHKVKNKGLRIYTSLDRELQKQAQKTIKNSSKFLDESRAYLLDVEDTSKVDVEAALLTTDPKTGHILAMVGGRDYSKTQFNRTVHALRSPGSAIKPVVFSLALEQGYKWSDMLYVSPIAIKDYRPKNYSDASYLTETTLQRAFYKSINTPTVEIAQKLGLEAVLEHGQKMGIKSELKKEIGTILGGSEVTMMDMATVYGTIANQGLKIDPIAILKITDRQGKILYEVPEKSERAERALTLQSAYLMLEGLRSVFKYGTGYHFRRHSEYAVGKTGTSNHAKDNWFCGFTPNHVTILWAGVEKHKGYESSVSASTLALPIWSSYIQKVKAQIDDEFIVPIGISSAKIHPKFGYLDDSGIEMFFIEGQEPEKENSNFKVISKSGSYRSLFDR